MSGIAVMAVVTIAVSALIWGAMVYVLAGRTRRYLWLMAAGLPLSAIVNLGVKRPLGLSAAHLAGINPQPSTRSPLWFLVFALLLAPVFEEAIKVTPLLIPYARRLVDSPGGAFWVGMTLGIGFGLGEAGYIAYRVAQDPAYARLPWFLFTGYLQERIIVCFAHGVTAAVVVVGLQRGGRWVIFGYLGAVGLHALVDTGALLYQLGIIPLASASAFLLLAVIALAGIFEWLRRRVLPTGGKPGASQVLYVAPANGPTVK